MGTGVDLTIHSLAAAIAEATGYRGKVLWDSSKHDGTPKKQLDVSRLMQLGWRARISLEDGLANTVTQFSKQFSQDLFRL